MATFERDKELQKQESAQQKKDMELEFERQAELQRQDLEARMETQRMQLEEKAAQDRLEMENRLSQQIAQALQSRTVSSPVSEPQPDFARLYANHERQIQMLTAMLARMDNQVVVTPRPTAKRQAELVDLTVDHQDFAALAPRLQHPFQNTDDDWKRRAITQTPEKPLLTVHASNDHPQSPSSELSVSMAATPDHRHPSTWIGYHHAPEIKSPLFASDPGPNHYDVFGDELSEQQHLDDTMTAPPFTPFVSQLGVLAESAISPSQLQDIHEQHQTGVTTPSPPAKGDTHTDMSLSSDGPNEDKPEPLQAKPKEESQTSFNHIDV